MDQLKILPTASLLSSTSAAVSTTATATKPKLGFSIDSLVGGVTSEPQTIKLAHINNNSISDIRDGGIQKLKNESQNSILQDAALQYSNLLNHNNLNKRNNHHLSSPSPSPPKSSSSPLYSPKSPPHPHESSPTLRVPEPLHALAPTMGLNFNPLGLPLAALFRPPPGHPQDLGFPRGWGGGLPPSLGGGMLHHPGMGVGGLSPAQQYHLYPWAFGRQNRLFGHRFPGPEFPTFLLPFRKPKRIRTAFSPSQLLKLEQAFEKNQYVVGQERKQLAQALDLSETQVKVWFQNRRTKHKRVVTDGDEEHPSVGDDELDDEEDENPQNMSDDEEVKPQQQQTSNTDNYHRRLLEDERRVPPVSTHHETSITMSTISLNPHKHPRLSNARDSPPLQMVNHLPPLPPQTSMIKQEFSHHNPPPVLGHGIHRLTNADH